MHAAFKPLLAASGFLLLLACSGGGGAIAPPPAAMAPAIIRQPGDVTVNAPAPASLDVVATGTAPLAYQWHRNGSAIPGAASASYATGPTSASDHGAVFTVTVSNGAGSITSQPAGLGVQWSSLLRHPANATVTAPAAATFEVAVQGNPATFTYQWRRDGQNLPAATSAGFTTAATSLADSGASYDCVITHATGVLVSHAATLTVEPAAIAPRFTQQPASALNLQTGQALRLEAGAEGTQPMSYQWLKDGQEIPGATAARLERTAAPEDSGSYVCRASNCAGQALSQASAVTVSPVLLAPTVTLEPQDQNVIVGSAATFQAAATGSTPMGCQWYRDGRPIAGAVGATYTTPLTGLADHGHRYMATFTNTAGRASTREAVLSVTEELSVGTDDLEPAVLGTLCTRFLSALGGTAPYGWRISAGRLPAGFSLASDGTLSGTGVTAALTTFTAEVTDAAQRKATREFAFRVRSTPRMQLGRWFRNSAAIANLGYTTSLEIIGGTRPRALQIQGSFPEGLHLQTSDAELGFGIGCKGTLTTPGDYTWTVRVTDAEGDVFQKTYTLKVFAASTLDCDPPALPEGRAGIPYCVTLTAKGGIPPYVFLPVTENQDGPRNDFWGIALSSDGVLAGTPAVAVETTVAGFVLDSAGAIGLIVRGLRIL